MTVTIKDVAKLAGVSIATVSRVMNHVDNVNPTVRDGVLIAMKELNFKPNRMAQSLKKNTTNTIGIIITDLKNPFFMEITSEIEKVVAQAGYSILITAVGDSAKKEYESLTMMVEKRVDGIIVASSGNNEDYLSELRDNGIPVVVIDRKSFSYRFNAVYIDKMKVMLMMNQYLFSKGHRRIVLATGAKKLSTNFDRYLGYVRSYYDAGFAVDESLIYYGNFSEEFGREVLIKALSESLRPTVIVSGSALITEGILKQAVSQNICIPEDISLVSFGNIQLSELIQPKLTYTESKQDEIGHQAAKILLAKMQDHDMKIIENVLSTRIIEGQSVKTISE